MPSLGSRLGLLLLCCQSRQERKMQDPEALARKLAVPRGRPGSKVPNVHQNADGFRPTSPKRPRASRCGQLQPACGSRRGIRKFLPRQFLQGWISTSLSFAKAIAARKCAAIASATGGGTSVLPAEAACESSSLGNSAASPCWTVLFGLRSRVGVLDTAR